MDHNNSVTEKHSHEQCLHGMCLKHNPEWEKVGERRSVPNPSFWGLKKTYWGEKCCGTRMARYKVVQTQKCRKCGHTRDEVLLDELAYCTCCGYHFDNTYCAHDDPC